MLMSDVYTGGIAGAGIVGKSGAAQNTLIYKQKRGNWLREANGKRGGGGV